MAFGTRPNSMGPIGEDERFTPLSQERIELARQISNPMRERSSSSRSLAHVSSYRARLIRSCGTSLCDFFSVWAFPIPNTIKPPERPEGDARMAATIGEIAPLNRFNGLRDCTATTPLIWHDRCVPAGNTIGELDYIRKCSLFHSA